MKVIISILLFIAALNAVELEPKKIIGKEVFGLIQSHKDKPVLDEKQKLIFPKNILQNEYLTIEKNNFIVSILEHNIGTLYITKLQDIDGKDKAYDTQILSVGNIGGIYSPVSGIKTSWNSILSVEKSELEIDFKTLKQNMMPYFENRDDLIKPYSYGWPFEIILLNNKGEGKVIKNYAMGRHNPNIIKIMPDEKTIYMLDSNGKNTLFAFVANNPRDFSTGELFAIEKKRTSLKWKSLGKFSALKMKIKLRKDLAFKDIFSSKSPKSDKCQAGFKRIETDGLIECLKVKTKMKKYAGAFESKRFAKIKGVKDSFSNIVNIEVIDDGLVFINKKNKKEKFSFYEDKKINSKFAIK